MIENTRAANTKAEQDFFTQTYVCVSEVGNVSFSENFAYVLNGSSIRAEVYSEPSRISEMELFTKIDNG